MSGLDLKEQSPPKVSLGLENYLGWGLSWGSMTVTEGTLAACSHCVTAVHLKGCVSPHLDSGFAKMSNPQPSNPTSPQIKRWVLNQWLSQRPAAVLRSSVGCSALCGLCLSPLPSCRSVCLTCLLNRSFRLHRQTQTLLPSHPPLTAHRLSGEKIPEAS